MKVKKREIILDLFLINEVGQVATVVRDENDIYEQGVVSALILTLPLGEHPVEYGKNYIKSKDLEIKSFEMLPCLYLNRFDSEEEVDYLVLSFKSVVAGGKKIKGDKENANIVWMNIEGLVNHPKLMPEFKKSKLKLG